QRLGLDGGRGAAQLDGGVAQELAVAGGRGDEDALVGQSGAVLQQATHEALFIGAMGAEVIDDAHGWFAARFLLPRPRLGHCARLYGESVGRKSGFIGAGRGSSPLRNLSSSGMAKACAFAMRCRFPLSGRVPKTP